MEGWFDKLLVSSLEEKKGLEAVKTRIHTHLDVARKSPDGLTALFSSYIESVCSLPEVRPQLKRITSAWRRGLVKNLREAQAMNEIRPEIDCNQQAAMSLGMIRGLEIDYLLGDRPDGLEVAEVALDLVVKEMISGNAPRQMPAQKKSSVGRTKNRLSQP